MGTAILLEEEGINTNVILTELQEEISKQDINNVGIFVDFDNIYYGFRDYGVNCEEVDYCIFTLMDKLYSKDKIRTMRAYADFDQVKVSLKNMQSKRVQIKNVYGNGKEEEYRKNASDIELSMDAIEAYYKDKDIDTYVFLTSDSDMIPVMSRMLYKGKKVHLYYINGNTTQYQNIEDYSHINCDLLKLFNIEKDRKNVSYWKDKALNLMNNWYATSKNPEDVIGGKLLYKFFYENLSLSKKLSSELIDYLIDNEFIEEKTTSIRKGLIVKV